MLFLLFSLASTTFPSLRPAGTFGVFVWTCTGSSVGLRPPRVLWPFAASPVASAALLSVHFCRPSSNWSWQEAWLPGVLDQPSRKEIKATELSKRKKTTWRQNPYLWGQVGEEQTVLCLESPHPGREKHQGSSSAISYDQMILGKPSAFLGCSFPICKMGMMKKPFPLMVVRVMGIANQSSIRVSL